MFHYINVLILISFIQITDEKNNMIEMLFSMHKNTIFDLSLLRRFSCHEIKLKRINKCLLQIDNLIAHRISQTVTF